MRILILGGDGYLGWPTAMRFSARGHDVFIVDNFARRRWHHEHGTDSLTPIRGLADRIDAWREVSGHEMHAFIGDINWLCRDCSRSGWCQAPGPALHSRHEFPQRACRPRSVRCSSVSPPGS